MKKFTLIIEDISGIVTTREITLDEIIVLLHSKQFIKEIRNIFLSK